MKHAMAMFTPFFFSCQGILSDLHLFSQLSISQTVSGTGKPIRNSTWPSCRSPGAVCTVPTEVHLAFCLNNDTGDWRSKKGQANPYLHTQTHSKRLGSSGSQDCLVLGMAHMWPVLPHFGRFHSDIRCSVLVIHRNKSQPCNWLAKAGNSLISEGTEAKEGQYECWRWRKTGGIDHKRPPYVHLNTECAAPLGSLSRPPLSRP